MNIRKTNMMIMIMMINETNKHRFFIDCDYLDYYDTERKGIEI